MSEAKPIAEHLRDAGFGVERFIDVRDGEKASVDHSTLAPDAVGGNYGIYAEATDGLAILDVDEYDGGVPEAVDDLPDTLTQRSPHGGEHRLYAVEPTDDGRLVAGVLADEFDAKNPAPSWGEVRTANQYVVGAGSQLDGCDKEWCDECAECDGGHYELAADRPIATIPADELLDVLDADPKTERRREAPDPDDAVPDAPAGGGRGFDGDLDDRLEYALENDDKLRQLFEGRAYRDYDDDRSQTESALAMKLGFWLGGDKRAVRRAMDQAKTRKWAERKDDSYRDSILSAADELTEYYDPENRPTTDGGGVSHSPSNTDSATPMGGLSPDGVAAVAELGEDQTVADLNDREKAAIVWRLLGNTDEYHVRVRRDNGSLWAYDVGVWKPEGERALRHAARQALGAEHYGSNVLDELKAQVRSDPRAEVDADEFGVRPETVAVENGLLDLEAAAEGKDARRDLRPEDYALAQLPVEYDPDASYDEWASYVEEWAEEGRADALQEYVGYCLNVNDLPIHRALMLVGSGSNGKGTFLHVVRALLGERNTSSIGLQTLANERDALAEFYGAVANIDDDLSARKLGAGLGMFKKLTAGDRVRARRLYQEGFEFEATGKHLYAANEVPDVKVSDDDQAFWRRWLLVEFPNHYANGEKDPDLRKRLSTDDALSGVLNWAIEGWQRLFDQGKFTGEPRYAHDKRERWQKWGDSIDAFVSGCVERDPDAANVSTSDVHRVFAAWCRQNDEQAASQQALTNHLKNEDLDYAQRVRPGGTGTPTRGFKALAFTDEAPELDETPERGSGQQSLG